MYQSGPAALMSVVGSLTGIRGKGAVMRSERSPAPTSAGVWSRAADDFRRWRSGDPGGLDDLVRGLSPVLWHVVRAYKLDSERAQDVVQTTWLTFVRRHESIVEPQAVAAWLTTTARREAWRAAKADSQHAPVGDDVLEAQLPTQASAEAAAVTDQESARLWSCVRRLSDRCQRLMRIVAFDDRPDYQGLAAEMQMPVGSIGPTRGRCLAKLKALLAEGEAEMVHG
jgi:RNA polymerase sigma factor (sigma-70 family)